MISNTDIEAVISLAIKAGNAIKKIYQMDDFSSITSQKDDHSPITLADKEAHCIISAGLKEYFPDIPLVSEESLVPAYENRKYWEKYWLIDPLDGTKEFLHRTGDFTVNIALMVQNKPYVGVIYAPVYDWLYYGCREIGAFKKSIEGFKPIITSQVTTNLVAVGSRLHSNQSKLLTELDIKQNKSIGSSLKFCLVAEGKADVYIRENPTMEWDTAAGQAILEAAGGTIVDISNHPFLYNKQELLNSGFVAHNGKLSW
jgi:3'(2'), 5'-bisphosphate nucleotidase